MFSKVAEHHTRLIYEIKKIGHQIYFSDKDNFVTKISDFIAPPCCHGNSDIVKTEF